MMQGGSGRRVTFGGEEITLPPINMKVVITVLGLLFLIILMYTSIYQIEADEEGVIKRFGKYIDTNPPGLHWKLPFGIETVTYVNTKRVFPVEFGFTTIRAGIETQYGTGKSFEESRMLTGDLNIAVIQWIVQYKRADPVKFLFNVRNVDKTIRDVAEAVMREVVGDQSVDEVIIIKRREIGNEVKPKMQALLDYYETGIEIITVELKSADPPERVKPAVNAVNTAKQEKEKIENQAWEAYNREIPKARGEAQKLIQEAEGYSLNRINRAKGDAEKFISIWQDYRLAKDVTRRRLYLEALQEVLPKIKKKFIVDSDQKGWLPLMRFDETKGRN
ncbi:FtsH protease activity modulator HflK [candidate division KSB1 bacterium]|nr:FtsH protease activity modulator HflK [candidate division KSB1 bacterium]